MNYIYSNGEFTIYDDSMETYKDLPSGIYRVNYHPQKGWWLTKDHDIKVNEKIYGDNVRRANKVIDTFKIFTRNLGVLLSGNKGMGKSLLCKLVCEKMVEQGYPIIIVDNYIPGISSFLHKIDTEVVVYMDEFDKMFRQQYDGYSDVAGGPQDEMLSLFDGIDTNKKLFLVTCNNIRDIGQYFINRTGRFHYHFRFTYPTQDEIKEYLEENIDSEYADEMYNVLAFSQKIRLNYDCLRSIAFEINHGYKFNEFIDDLNILNFHDDIYQIKVTLDSDLYVTRDNLDILQNDFITLYLYSRKDDSGIELTFNPSTFVYNDELQGYVPSQDDYSIKCNQDYMNSSVILIPDSIESFSFM